MTDLINPHQFRLFLIVAQKKSFSAAAEDLGITQPSVSIQIKRLEESLGLRLFDRMGQNVYLTTEGTVVLQYAKQMSSLVANLRSDLEDLKGLKLGRVWVGASRVPSTTTVPRAFALFKSRYPDAEIVITTGLSAEVEKLILANEIDLGVVAGRASSGLIVQEPFYEEELVLVLPAKHPLARQSHIRPEDVVEHPILLPYAGRVTEYLEKSFEEKGLVMTERVILGSREAVKTALSVGYGVSFLPKSAIGADGAAGVLVTKRVSGMALSFPLIIIYHKEKHLSRLALTFVEFLRDLRPNIYGESKVLGSSGKTKRFP
jgi:DNA-binding transcriptional LysR family regulator